MSTTADKTTTNTTNGKGKVDQPTLTDYVVLSETVPFDIVHEGKYLRPNDAFAAAVAKTTLGDGDTASFIVIAARYLKPRKVKVEVERKLVYS